MNKYLSGRRNFPRTVALGAPPFSITSPWRAVAQTRDKNMLVIYFSHSGNTSSVAREIPRLTSADIYQILPITLYPENYHALVELAEKQTAENKGSQYTILYEDEEKSKQYGYQIHIGKIDFLFQ